MFSLPCRMPAGTPDDEMAAIDDEIENQQLLPVDVYYFSAMPPQEQNRP